MWRSSSSLALLLSVFSHGEAGFVEVGRHDSLRGAFGRAFRERHHEAAAASADVRYFLLQYSNQFCGGEVGACQELVNDGNCHLTGVDNDAYVKMVDNEDGTVTVQPGDDASCNCRNADALTATYVVDALDRYGHWKAKQNSGCLTGSGIGVRLVKGQWCVEDTFHTCAPADSQFTKLMQSCPTTSLNANVSSGGMCNYPGFHVKRSAPAVEATLSEDETTPEDDE